MRATKLQAQLASTLALLNFLSGTCAQQDGRVGRLFSLGPALASESPLQSDALNPVATDADVHSLSSSAEEHPSRRRSRSPTSFTKTTTTSMVF